MLFILLLNLLMGIKSPSAYSLSQENRAACRPLQETITTILVETTNIAPVAFYHIDELDEMTTISKNQYDTARLVEHRILGSKNIYLNYSLSNLRLPFIILPGDSVLLSFSENALPFVKYSKFHNEKNYNCFYDLALKQQTLFRDANFFLLKPASFDLDTPFRNDSTQLALLSNNNDYTKEYVQTCIEYLYCQYKLERFIKNNYDIDTIFLSNENYLAYPNFRDLLAQYLYLSITKHFRETDKQMIAFFNAASIKKGEIKNYLLFYAMQWMKNKNQQLFTRNKSRFLTTCSNANYTNIISTETTTNKIAGAAELQAFDSEDKLSLAAITNANKGYVLIIDLWASWCAPCRASVPVIKRIKEQYLNKPVKFVFISIDDKEDAWKKAVREERLAEIGKNYFVLNFKKSLFAKKYKITEVPRYLIFDKKGKLAQEFADYPGTNEFETELLKLIAEK